MYTGWRSNFKGKNDDKLFRKLVLVKINMGGLIMK